ncbi:MAG: transposase, partial [Verrucomicrobiia bacterium]
MGKPTVATVPPRFTVRLAAMAAVQTAQAYLPRLVQRAAVAEAFRSVFNSPTRPAAERRLKVIVATYAPTAPKLAAWMEENLPHGLTVFALPTAHQKRLRTTNALERV